MTLMKLGKVIFNNGTRKKVKSWNVKLVYKAKLYWVFLPSRAGCFRRLKCM